MKNKKDMRKIKAAAAISALVLTAIVVLSGPSMIADTTPPENTYTSAVTVTLTASDNQSGVEYIQYTVIHDGVPSQNRVYNETATFVCDESGEYTIEYFAVDWAGNVETTKSKSFTIVFDITPPDTEIDLQGDLLQ